MDNFEFIGKEYKDEDEKHRVLQYYDEYELSKLRYLNSKNDILPGTKITYWRVYQKVHIAERKYEKDLKFFNTKDIENIAEGNAGMSLQTANSILSFCRQYCEYCISKGDIKINPYENFTPEMLTNETYIKSKIISMDKFHEIFNRFDRKKLNTNPENIKPLLLARYGIIGKKGNIMLRLRYNDIDVNNMVINIENEHGKNNKFPIDNMFIQFLKELNNDTNTDIFQSDKYVLNNSHTSLKYHTMNTRINTACESVGNDRISLGNLLFTRQIEILLKKRAERKLYTLDLKEVLELFKEYDTDASLDTSASTLKIAYEKLTGDKVIPNRIKESLDVDLYDPNSKKFAELKAEKLGLNIADTIITNIIDQEDSHYQDDIYAFFNEDSSDTSNYEFEKREKKELIQINNIGTYPRDNKIGLLALKLAGYTCSFNEKYKPHESFISQTTSKNYVEAHHIIPIKYHYLFEADIDNEANIVALCPNCHRLLHYGKFEDKIPLLEKLYDKHNENLKKVGLKIEKHELIDMYRR